MMPKSVKRFSLDKARSAFPDIMPYLFAPGFTLDGPPILSETRRW